MYLLWSPYNDTGEVVGAFSFSVGQGANMLRKIASVRAFHQGHDVQNIVSHPLRGRVSMFHLIYALIGVIGCAHVVRN